MLRGINVGGQKKVKMEDLRSLYESLGFQNICTYIQSGNVIFECELTNMAVLKAEIEKAIEEKYQFHVPVEIRTDQELKQIINNCPFDSIDINEEGAKYLVTFLSSIPLESKVSEIHKSVSAPEDLVVSGQEIYLNCPNGYGKSKLSNTFIESKLGIKATTRNWKTVNKLYELSQ